MCKYHMTQSLLGAWLYQYEAFDSEKAHEDFLKVLNREQRETTEAMQAGIDFENEVYSFCENEKDSQDSCVQEVARMVKGGQFQVVATKDIKVCGLSFELYGILDVLKCGEIYDLKFSKTYETGKYLNSPQHPMYFEIVPEATAFAYIICNGTNVCIERYRRDETQSVIRIIEDFICYLKQYDLFEIYLEKWVLKT